MILYLQKKALGQELYEQVFYHLDLVEKDYFGLQFTDVTHVSVSIHGFCPLLSLPTYTDFGPCLHTSPIHWCKFGWTFTFGGSGPHRWKHFGYIHALNGESGSNYSSPGFSGEDTILGLSSPPPHLPNEFLRPRLH